jgi:hypothetical protein
LHTLPSDGARHVEAVTVGQHHVEDDEVEGLASRATDGGVAVTSGLDAIALRYQPVAEGELQAGLVFD